MNIRKMVFFALDRDKSVQDQLNEIERANTDDKFAYDLQKKCISSLIKHIKENVPFYNAINAEKFEDLPIVNKVMMKDNMESFRDKSGIPIGKIRHTSGSTGIPFEIFQDIKKSKRIQAEVIYYRRLTGDDIGTKYINLISPSNMEKTTKLGQIKQNVVAFDVTKMDSPTMEDLFSLLKKNNGIKYMMGYASALEKIANYFEEHNYQGKCYLPSIVSCSEVLTENTAKKLIEVFGGKVYDRYSNEDNGFIAQTDGITHEFIVNRGSYYVEILKLETDEPAEENEIGRIVVTDYYNYAQPFVRYDTGDLGAFSYKKINGSVRYVLTKVAGRKSDVVYDIYDRPISTFAIGCALEVFSKIKQYQLIQESKNTFTLNIIDPDKHYKDCEYIEALMNVLGEDITVKINYSENLPTLNSGKFRRVICNYKPEKV